MYILETDSESRVFQIYIWCVKQKPVLFLQSDYIVVSKHSLVFFLNSYLPLRLNYGPFWIDYIVEKERELQIKTVEIPVLQIGERY